MILEGHIYCEGPDCENHQHVSAQTMASGQLPAHWLEVLWYGHDVSAVAFCGWDCVMKYAAKFPAPERVE